MHLVFKKEVTFNLKDCYFNPLMLLGCVGEDGLEYYYTIFDMACCPSIIDKIRKL